MTGEQPSRIARLLNAPSPSPEPAPSPPPAAPATGPPPLVQPPAQYQTPAPPSSGATGSVKYTESALERFAQTSDERATAFGQAEQRAQTIEVGHDAFGWMFGALVYSAYEKHVHAVTDSLYSAEMAMSDIAAAMRDTAHRVRAEEESGKQAMDQIGAEL